MRIAKIITTLVCLNFCHMGFAQVGANASVVNPNLAKKGELIALVRVMAAIADKIIGDTLSDKGEATLRAKLFLHINLNMV